MSLFQFRCQHTLYISSSSVGAGPSQGVSLPDHTPAFEEPEHGMVEFESTISTVSDLADPTPMKTIRGT